MTTVRDQDIRAELNRQLDQRHAGDPDTRVVNEMGVLVGSSRIDVAVINGRLEGFEIKSERDNLSRLPRQALAYGRVFDRLTAVCAERHVAHAREVLPPWWGIKIAEPDGESVHIVQQRGARANHMVDPGAVAQLLWRHEALDLLDSLGRARGLRSKPKRVLWTALVEALPPRELRAMVRERLRARKGWLAAD